MTRFANDSSSDHGQEKVSGPVLCAVDLVIALCRSSLPDAAVEREIRELEVLRSASESSWPLPATMKNKIDLGSFAAKNIADWNPHLADTLMQLEYSLKHDGAMIEQVLATAASAQEAASLTL